VERNPRMQVQRNPGQPTEDFANGSLATFDSTRDARGNKRLYTFEINGEKASIVWDLDDLHDLQYFNHNPPRTRQDRRRGGPARVLLPRR
jgi:predicted dehydrogenase